MSYLDFCYCGYRREEHDSELKRYDDIGNLTCPIFTSLAPEDRDLAGKLPEVVVHYKSYECQRCGDMIGWLGRAMEWAFGTMHDCPPIPRTNPHVCFEVCRGCKNIIELEPGCTCKRS